MIPILLLACVLGLMIWAAPYVLMALVLVAASTGVHFPISVGTPWGKPDDRFIRTGAVLALIPFGLGIIGAAIQLSLM